jgi:choline dehydrogenase-like flavoprotein
MVYYRGHPYDYDLWAHWTKDPRWSYESVLPLFLKHEDYCIQCEPHDSPLNRKNNTFTLPWKHMKFIQK